ncbi:MAG: hypothetical protein ABIS28_19825 [Caldimonas sp.]
MRTDLVSWRPGGTTSPAAPAAKAQLANYLTLGGALLALALLIGFYWVVSSLVQRAENGRQQARLAIERQVVCSAFGSTASRELCASTTVATHIPANAMLRASYEAPAWNGRKRQSTASLH